MSRRPLVPLLALAALLALPPAVRGINCFQCEDPNPYVLPPLPGSPSAPRCSGFDTSRSDFKVERCLFPYVTRCARISWSGGEMRGCLDSTLREGCEVEDGVSFCSCTGDYCNSAGLSTPALLLLLPAALLAALYAV
ncbi:hypothetical protein FJT64_013685 [Amphibalanus amphitrite]|uniref:Protein sleepless n=1 Tax=Amphibalanus amphitrite TaxID=1232801 RepID=A0A6A4V449_AMPAM|nr:hypothetical protein FJT64_013685 [Amphibalanus amphitrite]